MLKAILQIYYNSGEQITTLVMDSHAARVLL